MSGFDSTDVVALAVSFLASGVICAGMWWCAGRSARRALAKLAEMKAEARAGQALIMREIKPLPPKGPPFIYVGLYEQEEAARAKDGALAPLDDDRPAPPSGRTLT